MACRLTEEGVNNFAPEDTAVATAMRNNDCAAMAQGQPNHGLLTPVQGT